jgi:hypothetical protein
MVARTGLRRARHDHPYQETTTPRSPRLGERVQHRRQSHTMENRTNHREPENLENPPHRLPPTTGHLPRDDQRGRRTTILPTLVNKPLGIPVALQRRYCLDNTTTHMRHTYWGIPRHGAEPAVRSLVGSVRKWSRMCSRWPPASGPNRVWVSDARDHRKTSSSADDRMHRSPFRPLR